MWTFFELKRNRYNLRVNYFLKLPDTNMAHNHYASKEFLCGIRFFCRNLILTKNSRVISANGILLPVAVKFVNRQILDFPSKGS